MTLTLVETTMMDIVKHLPEKCDALYQTLPGFEDRTIWWLGALVILYYQTDNLVNHLGIPPTDLAGFWEAYKADHNLE